MHCKSCCTGTSVASKIDPDCTRKQGALAPQTGHSTTDCTRQQGAGAPQTGSGTLDWPWHTGLTTAPQIAPGSRGQGHPRLALAHWTGPGTLDWPRHQNTLKNFCDVEISTSQKFFKVFWCLGQSSVPGPVQCARASLGCPCPLLPGAICGAVVSPVCQGQSSVPEPVWGAPAPCCLVQSVVLWPV